MCDMNTVWWHIPVVHNFGPRWQRQADLSELEVSLGNIANSSEAEYAWALLIKTKQNQPEEQSETLFHKIR